jgi:hypothetical protein
MAAPLPTTQPTLPPGGPGAADGSRPLSSR